MTDLSYKCRVEGCDRVTPPRNVVLRFLEHGSVDTIEGVNCPYRTLDKKCNDPSNSTGSCMYIAPSF
ncbi:hypothetical protein J4218_04955 [Candidatus Pacearchaeota archaeon]|nr:hypothetical protein [Candidatus Pacearchaeota archaeon]